MEDDPIKTAAEHAVDLLSQQIWCWGCDIKRPEGNWLVELGFERTTPPAGRESCSSIYALSLPRGRCVVLRGFGVFYGDPKYGSIFCPRYEFCPLYTTQAKLDRPLWSNTDLPNSSYQNCSQRNSCVSLMLNLIDWIKSYEEQITDRLGIEYRQATLMKWHNGDRPFIASEEIIPAWHELGHQLATDSQFIFEKRLLT